MKIAFIILAYHLPKQVRALVDELDHIDHHFFIHIDKSKDLRPFKEFLQTSNAKIHWIKRENSFWGSYQCVKALLNGIKQSFNHDIKFDYFIHLSGQDFSLKGPNYINQVLQEQVPKNFININPIDSKKVNSKGKQRLLGFKFFFKNTRYVASRGSSHLLLRYWAKFWNFIIIFFDNDKQYFDGEFYFMLHRSGVKELIKQLDSNRLLSLRLRFTVVPEEMFIHTLLGISPLSSGLSIVNDEFRYIDWSKGGRSPRILNFEDYVVLKDSKYLFGRKFNFFNG